MYLKDYNVNDEVDGAIVICVSKKKGVSSRNTEYISYVFRDNTETMEGKAWQVSDSTDSFDAGDCVRLFGTIQSYNGRRQIIVTRAEAVNVSDEIMQAVCPSSTKSFTVLESDLFGLIDSVKDEHLKRLLLYFFDNEDFMNSFKNHSAAKTVHHATVGGLLEHSVSVALIVNNACKYYPEVNHDLAVTAALLHDIGKLFEISDFPENDYTNEGQLMGHIYIGARMIETAIAEIEATEEFPADYTDELVHCVLSHHGSLEYGSPVTPHLIEAQLVSYADDMDAKMRRFSDIIHDMKRGQWSDEKDFFLGSRIKKSSIV